MGSVLRWVSLRHLLHDAGSTGLTLLGVALGVSVFLAVRLANHSALASFSDTVDAVAGRANLQVTGDSLGFDESLFDRVREVPGVQAAAPAVQLYVQAAPGPVEGRGTVPKGQDGAFSETLLVLGLNPALEGPFQRVSESEVPDEEATALLLDPSAVAVTAAFAARAGLEVGDSLTLLVSGRPHRVTVRHLLRSEELQSALGGNLLVMGLGAAQITFGRPGRIDRIDLIVEPGRLDEVRAVIQGRLPPGVRVDRPSGRTRQVENMVRAFGLNLSALSFIALFVATFLIFNAVSMSVLRRRREIGILRSLGLTRRAVLAQFLLEGLFLGAVGGTAGLVLGTFLARGALDSVARTISTLYLIVRAREVDADPGTYLGALLVGLGVSLAASFAPALEAAATPPAQTVREGSFEATRPVPVVRLALAGGGLLAAAGAASAAAVGMRFPEAGFAAAFLLLLGFSLLAPAAAVLMEKASAPVLAGIGGIAWLLGARYLRESLARTSVIVAALMVAVGMLVGLTVMVVSFRRTVDVWVGQTLRGDLYVEPVGRGAAGSTVALPREVPEQVRRIPGVAAMDTYRGLNLTLGDRLVHLAGIDFEVQRDYGRQQFLDGDSRETFDRALRDGAALVSESLAFRLRVGKGDRLRLDTPSGRVTLPIAGVYYDYSTDSGTLLIDRRLYRRLWRDDRTESMALYLRPAADPQQVRSRVVELLGPRMAIHATPNQELRRRVLAVFDQTFRITWALQGIAVVVAVLGVITTVTALVTQRGREIGVLRAVGAQRGQVRRMVLVECGLLGAIGAALGSACGVALSLLLTYVINKQFFGWSITWTLPLEVFPQAALLMVGTALAAGWVPAGVAAGRRAAEAMRRE